MTSRVPLIRQSCQLHMATRLFSLGARLPVVMHETALPRTTLRQLHIELTGQAPGRGVLPFTIDWYLQWRHNIHASLFANIHAHLGHYDLTDTERLIQSYTHYLGEIAGFNVAEPILSITRAWTLLRFCRQRMLQLTPCQCCQGYFISSGHLPASLFTCGVCKPPPHAGHRQPKGHITSTSFPKEVIAEAG